MYLVSFLAVNAQGRVVHVPGRLPASSENDAKTKAYTACLDHFPSSEGWRDHSVSVMEG